MPEVAATDACLPIPRTGRDRIIACGGAVLAMLLFGGSFVAGRDAILAGLTPADMVALRFAVSGLIFAPMLLRRGMADLRGIGWRGAVAITLFGGAPYNFIVLLGLSFSPAAHGVVLSPGMTMITGIFLAHVIVGERAPPWVVLAVPLVLVGLVLVPGAGVWSSGSGTWLGDAILASSGVSYALYTILLRRWRIAALPGTAAVCVLSALVTVPWYILAVGFRPLLNAPLAEVVGQAVFQGAFVGVGAVFLYTRAIAVLGSSRAVLFPTLVPVFGTMLAIPLLGERLSALQGAGIIAVCVGMAIAAWRPRA